MGYGKLAHWPYVRSMYIYFFTFIFAIYFLDSNTVIPEINACLNKCKSANFKGFNKNAILLMRKQGIPVYNHYKMFKNRNYNNMSQKRLAKFALIKYRINFRIYGITVRIYVRNLLFEFIKLIIKPVLRHSWITLLLYYIQYVHT